MTACHDVFGIPELSEIIFLELSMRDLLCAAQQTCQQWKAIISSSNRLQEALFLRPISATRLVQVGKFGRVEYHWGHPSGALQQEIYRHPILDASASNYRTRNIECFKLPQASWRNCLVSQPPISRMSTHTQHTHITKAPGSLEIKSGITLGDVFAIDPREARVIMQSWNWEDYLHAAQFQALKIELGKVLASDKEA